jgi:hypothetical protein
MFMIDVICVVCYYVLCTKMVDALMIITNQLIK